MTLYADAKRHRHSYRLRLCQLYVTDSQARAQTTVWLLFYCCSQLLVKHIELTNDMTRTLGEKMRQGEPDTWLRLQRMMKRFVCTLGLRTARRVRVPGTYLTMWGNTCHTHQALTCSWLGNMWNSHYIYNIHVRLHTRPSLLFCFGCKQRKAGQVTGARNEANLNVDLDQTTAVANPQSNCCHNCWDDWLTVSASWYQ